jgi:hypothetical protein
MRRSAKDGHVSFSSASGILGCASSGHAGSVCACGAAVPLARRRAFGAKMLQESPNLIAKTLFYG